LQSPKQNARRSWRRHIPVSNVSLLLLQGFGLIKVFSALSKILEAARVSSTRPKSVLSVQAHLATLNELDSSRLSHAKLISDAEGLLASREAELAALKEETQSLEVYDPAVEHVKELDGTAFVYSYRHSMLLLLRIRIGSASRFTKDSALSPLSTKTPMLAKL
jgi:hypothetical protein